ncbi:hypothetical protein J0H58_10015, partial [bacterium]|nr:hypothetical protein [bacterium]
MRQAIAAVVLVSWAAVAQADPPRLVHRVELNTGGQEKARYQGMTFLPDGVQVAVRWGWVQLRDDTPVTKMTLFGGPNREPETISAPSVPFRAALLSGGQIAVTKSGDLLTPDSRARLFVRSGTTSPDTPPTRQIELNQGLSAATGTASLVWLTSPDEALVVAGHGLDAAYDLARVEGRPLKDGRGRTKLLLKGGPRDDRFLCADLHPSGQWFAALYVSPRNENPRADFWKVGEPASKKTARLASLGQSVAIAT